ncbi:3',5'-cyclic AMP phosphodiesterase CpdA [Variovorax sp. 54]|uniref:phosphodiesterase n=1 Tax=Variovorax sp. 54 TaxID=2035212 RepID=UPI000C1980E6|nr:phosphodiesterase [Variovorax sp. 54]PIF77090.1 3',5'-cyclic AMP phosphodiesterase CpdA [Variovorax sp. 54]
MTTTTANPNTFLVQLTDLHIREPGRLAYGRIDTAPYLARAVQSVLALRQPPDAVVITGDLTDFGRAAEYEHLAALLAPLAMPVYLLPGNHDDRDQLRRSFPDHAYLGTGADTHGFVQYSVRVGDLRLLTLDTCVPGASHGTLCDKRLAWLEAQLDACRHEPVVVAMHHPPFETLIGHMDEIGLLEGADALEALLRRYTNVERVICGHLHRAIDVRFGGTIASTSPAQAHQVCLDLAPDAASAWTLEPPSFRVHAWSPAGGRLVTHLAASGSFEGPYPFHDNGALID